MLTQKRKRTYLIDVEDYKALVKSLGLEDSLSLCSWDDVKASLLASIDDYLPSYIARIKVCDS